MDTLLREAHQNIKDSTDDKIRSNDSGDMLNHVDSTSIEEFRNQLIVVDHSQPWSKANDVLAPEDEETELLVHFKDALTFLGKSRDEAIKDYYNLLETHVSEEMREKTDIIRLLQTKALSVFVPDELSGIKGIEPLSLKWKDTLPDRMKPKARPINPKLWEALEKEFHRLCDYFYGKSRSP